MSRKILRVRKYPADPDQKGKPYAELVVPDDVTYAQGNKTGIRMGAEKIEGVVADIYHDHCLYQGGKSPVVTTVVEIVLNGSMSATSGTTIFDLLVETFGWVIHDPEPVEREGEVPLKHSDA